MRAFKLGIIQLKVKDCNCSEQITKIEVSNTLAIHTTSSKGPFKYYVIKILTLLDPTHPVCNQSLFIKQRNFMLLRNHLAYPNHPLLLIT